MPSQKEDPKDQIPKQRKEEPQITQIVTDLF
jgi:hypothetical protein